MKCKKGLNEKSGFTLIEMAVVLVIIGIVISIVATVLPALIQSAKIRKASAILEKVDYSLEGYISASGQCPCPDTDGNGKENRNDGGTPDDPTDDTCTAYIGNLPYLTLGLSSGEDNWHNPIKYAVYEDLIKTTSSTGSNYYCYKLRDIINYYRTNAPDTNKLYTTSGSENANQAYVIVTGGPKDLDGTGGFFDGYNGSSPDLQYESPNKIIDKDYDDLLRAVSFNYLRGRECSGGGGGGGGSGGVENGYPSGCTNGIDDDGDLMIDCDDPDCKGDPACLQGGENVKIATTSIPSGAVNSDYSTTLTASGGITPYEWELTANGGFTDFYLHPYTGNLSGTISLCPGAHSIQVKVVDSTQPTITSDTESFSIEVTKDLSVARTSGDGSTNITWNSTTQEETFKVQGGYLGDISWVLDAGGASGFAYNNTGNTTVIQKDGITTAGSYTFTLTATDSECATNTENIVLTVDVTASGAPAPYIEGMEAEWRFDECNWDGTAGEVKDSGEHALDGTAQNGADTTGAGKICKAGSFDGTDDYVIVDDSDGALNQTAAFSIALWVKVHGNQSDWVRLAGKGNHPDHNYGLWLDTNGTILFHIDSASGQGRSQTTVTVDDGNWHHVVGVYDFTTMKVYIDNIERSSIDYSNTPYTSNDPFTMGYDGQYTYLNGCLDEVMLFNKALPATSETETSVDDIYKLTRSSCSGTCYADPVAEYRMENYAWSGTAGEVTDSGSGGSNGVAALRGSGVIPSQTTPSGGKVCRTGVFTRVDASNGGYLDLGDPADGDLDPGTDPWTMSAWIKWDGSSGENIIFNKENLYETKVSGGYVNYAWQPSWIWYGGTSFPVTKNVWTYVTTVYDGSQQILYKDGAEVFSRTETGGAMGSNGSKFLIGARGNTSPVNFFGGMIDEVKIYNRALAENEIAADKDETRDCAADSVVITTTSLNNGVINSAYSYTIAATGGTTPYGWELLSSEIPGLSIVPNTGELYGTIDECTDTYSIAVRVTDAASRTDERTFTLTVANATLTISPSAPRTFNCTTTDFYRDFTVSGARLGALTNWAITWLGTNPGGFEVIKTEDATVRFRKISTSTVGNGYQFKLTANDITCTDNTIDSGYYTLNVSGDGAGTPYYAKRVADWWLDEFSGTIEDHSSQNNDGTTYGGVTYGVQGKVWTALGFDGSSGYVHCGNDASLKISAGDFTMGAWIKPASHIATAGQRYTVMAKFNPGWIMDLPNDGGKEGYRFHSGSAAYKYTPSGDQFSLEWTHFIVTRNSTTNKLKLYLNSELKETWDMTTVTASANPVLIGKRTDGYWFNGIIDEAQIYNRELSAAEITDLYNQASLVAYYKMDETEGGTAPGGKDIYDYSGQANYGTNTGAIYGVDGQVGIALDFDGTAYVNVGSSAELRPSDISISLWAKASQLDTYNGIFTNKQGPADGINLLMGTSQNIATLVGDGSSYSYIRSTIVPVVGTWYHIVITHNSADNNNILYVNGTNEKEGVMGLSYTAGDTIIGRFYRSSLPFKGAIDEVRVYNRVLSADEVTDLFIFNKEGG